MRSSFLQRQHLDRVLLSRPMQRNRNFPSAPTIVTNDAIRGESVLMPADFRTRLINSGGTRSTCIVDAHGAFTDRALDDDDYDAE